MELEKITRESKKAENLRLELLNRTYFENTEDLDQAIQHKNKFIIIWMVSICLLIYNCF